MASRRLTQLQRSILLIMLEEEERLAQMAKDNPLLEAAKPTPFFLFRSIRREELERRRERLNRLEDLAPETLEGEIVARLGMGDSTYYIFYEIRSRLGCVTSSVKNLERKGLVLRIERLRRDELGRRRPRLLFTLSPRGRLMAKMLRFEKSGKAKVDAMADELIEKAVKALREEKAKNGQPPYATAIEILEKLWQLSPELYENEHMIFDRYWNKKKLGEKMNKNYELTRKTLNGRRVWVYKLYKYSCKEKAADLRQALLTIRRKNFWRATTEDIKDALWKVCGAKFASKEAFEAEWNEELIGKLMKEMGFPKRQKYAKTWDELADGTIIPVYYIIWYYDIRTVPKNGNSDNF